VYAFCRWTDNTVDEAHDVADAMRRLAQARDALVLAYSDRPAPPGLAAFRHTVRTRGIPRKLFEELLEGMAMDLTIARYADFPALDLYCYRVAGVVGLMMTHVFGYRHERCFPHAVALGRAMQLTNILRDVKEDLDRGRIYLPQDELARFGIGEDQLAAGRVDEPFRAFMRFQIDRARAAYADAGRGIPDLIGRASRLTVRVMSRLYGAILDEIERLDYDVFSRRAATSTRRKLALLSGCLTASLGDDLRRLGTHRP
jgi:phytoene synthase